MMKYIGICPYRDFFSIAKILLSNLHSDKFVHMSPCFYSSSKLNSFAGLATKNTPAEGKKAVGPRFAVQRVGEI